SLGSFSEAQAVVDPQLLAGVLAQLSAELPAKTDTASRYRWLVQDGSLFEALPRMHWALWRRQGTVQAQVRLHLSLERDGGAPAHATITPGRTCERKVWRRHWQRGEAYVGDRYYGEDYEAFKEMQESGMPFVVRLRDEAVFNVEEELVVSQNDQRAGVIRAAWGRLGSTARYRSIRVRVIWVQTPREVLRLVTNLEASELSAGDVALLYKERWQVELFFRWIKCILGCRHWLAESPRGVQVQVYLALIAAVLLQLYTGRRPTKRVMEMIQFYLLGVATLQELCAAVERANARAAKKA
ncbi:MAG TPA: IS4 family transposase, partial [Opitutaceae bacterium]